MNKVSVSAIAAGGTPTVAACTYSPDNSQNARRFMAGLACDEFGGNSIQLELSEMTAPSDAKGGPAKVVCRVRAAVPQLKWSMTDAAIGSGLVMSGQSEFFQSVHTVTVPALWAKVLLGAVPATEALRLQAMGLIRCIVLDAVNGILGDLKPSTAFAATAWTTMPTSSSPLFRALQGANPEDVFNGSYGVS